MSKISLKQFKKEIASENLDRVYFIYGNEKYLIKQCESIITEKIIGSGSGGLDFMEINGENINKEALSLYLESYPVTLPKKCALIRNLIQDSNNISNLIEIISDSPDFSVIVISQRTIECDSKWKKTIEAISSLGTVVEVSSKDDVPIEKRLIEWSKGYGKTLSQELAKTIKERCGTDLYNLKNEIDKLCHYENSNIITSKSIQAVTVSSMESNVFTMCNALLSANYKKMYKYLDMLFYMREAPPAILSVIAGFYIDIYRVRAAQNNNIPLSQISKAFDYKKKEFRIDAAKRNSSKMKMSDIRNSIELLALSDQKLKSSGLDPRLIIDHLIAKLILTTGGK